MAKGGSKGKYNESAVRRREDSVDTRDHRPKKKHSNLIDEEFAKKFPIPPNMIPPGFNPMMPPPNPAKGMPMILPGMPLPPSVLMNMPLPPPDSNPDEIKKALKMIMSNFPLSPKDVKMPVSPVQKQPSARKKARREPPADALPPPPEDLMEREVDKRLEEIDAQDDSMVSRLIQIPGLLIKRFLKKETIDDIERNAKKRKQRVRYSDSFDFSKYEYKPECAHWSAALDKAFEQYSALELGKVEGVLPFVDGLE